MGIFNLIFGNKKPKLTKENIGSFLLDKYFDSNREQLFSEAKHLLEITKYDVDVNDFTAIILRCLGFRELKAGWTELVRNTLNNDFKGRLPETELKWLYVYCDVHYINKDNEAEMILIAELGGRQIGMPSPLGNISNNYRFK